MRPRSTASRTLAIKIVDDHKLIKKGFDAQ